MATQNGMRWDYSDMEADSDFLDYQYGSVHWKPISKKATPITFPAPKDININMMPFIVEPSYNTIPEVSACFNYYVSQLKCTLWSGVCRIYTLDRHLR